jgi:aryl-alcohol dehydrogenase-like predicted oxidoreductase
MKTRKLGNDMEVSVIAMGCMTFLDGAVQSSIDVVDSAIEAGINFFDTAPMYGQGESEIQNSG